MAEATPLEMGGLRTVASAPQSLSSIHLLAIYFAPSIDSENTGGRFPAALQDALTSYVYLIFDLAILPSNIILSGDSAGGHMALQLLRYISDHGAELSLPLPQCAWL